MTGMVRFVSRSTVRMLWDQISRTGRKIW